MFRKAPTNSFNCVQQQTAYSLRMTSEPSCAISPTLCLTLCVGEFSMPITNLKRGIFFLIYSKQTKRNLKNLMIKSINGMTCFHSSNWQSILVLFRLLQSNGWLQNIYHSNLVAAMAIRAVLGTGFRLIPKTKMMDQKYWITKATGAIFSKTGKRLHMPILPLLKG